jgi:amidase
VQARLRLLDPFPRYVDPIMSGHMDLHWRRAHDLAAAIRTRELSVAEVLEHHLDRIGAVDEQLNAIVTLADPDDLRAAAAAADRAVAAGEPLGPLHGLPVAVKDLMDARGLPTSQGSRAYRDAPPAQDDHLMVARMRAAGAIIVGKTNTPEFGLGTLTFNDVFGPTRNPYDLSRHAGGSSGGAAAAVAAGLLPVADGSDSGGSLRYPASFCNVVGLRPSAGRVPSSRVGDGWSPHGVLGPMARTCADAGLLLAAIAGPHPAAPIALQDDPAAFAFVEPADLRGARVAWSDTVGGLPIDPQVTEALRGAREILEALGCVVEDVEPDLEGADECWEVIELLGFLMYHARDVDEHPGELRDDLVRNVREARTLTPERIVAAQAKRSELFRSTARMLERYDLLALPATPVTAPPVEVPWVAEIAGVRMERYFHWQRAACRVTVMSHPALALPAAFAADGLPVGLQLVGRHRDDLGLLRAGAAIEAATGLAGRHPSLMA